MGKCAQAYPSPGTPVANLTVISLANNSNPHHAL